MVAYSFQRRFVGPIRVGLGISTAADDVMVGGGLMMSTPTPKRQTIRAHGKRRHARPGETLQLYCGMRSQHCFKIGEARCTAVHEVELMVGRHTIAFLVDGEPVPDHARFVESDGFSTAEDMIAFWHAEHRGVDKFEGLLIRWEAMP